VSTEAAERALTELEQFAIDHADTRGGQQHVAELAAIVRAELGIRENVLALWDDNNAWIPGGDFAALADALGVPHKRTLTHRDGGFSRPALDLWS
jgi:hypothetical protein